MENIMVLAGGNDQIELIKTIRHKYPNTDIILIDYLDTPVAKRYANKHIQVSTLDRDKVLEIAVKEKIGMIITVCTDQALLTMAYVSEKLNLPCYLTYQQALEVTNKKYMKNKMKSKGIHTPHFSLVDSADQIEGLKLEYPLVIKPVDSNSSKGICKITSPDNIQHAYKIAKGQSLTGEVIVEEFVKGTEYSVDAFVVNGVAKILLITKTIKNRNNACNFTITQSYYDPNLDKKLQVNILKSVQTIADAFHIENAPMIVQIISVGTQVYVIEFSARTGGGSKTKLISFLAGVDVIEKTLSLIRGERVEVGPIHNEAYACLNYVYTKQGEYAGLRNLEKIVENHTIETYFLYKGQNTFIEKAVNSSDRVMGFLICAANKQELAYKQKKADEYIRIYDKQGKDMMLHGIYEL